MCRIRVQEISDWSLNMGIHLMCIGHWKRHLLMAQGIIAWLSIYPAEHPSQKYTIIFLSRILASQLPYLPYGRHYENIYPALLTHSRVSHEQARNDTLTGGFASGERLSCKKVGMLGGREVGCAFSIVIVGRFSQYEPSGLIIGKAGAENYMIAAVRDG